MQSKKALYAICKVRFVILSPNGVDSDTFYNDRGIFVSLEKTEMPLSFLRYIVLSYFFVFPSRHPSPSMRLFGVLKSTKLYPMCIMARRLT